MEGAGEGGLVALADAGEGGAAVLAGVDQGMQLAVAVAGDDHRLAAGAQGHEVMLVGDLALVTGVDPVLLEDQFHLQVEQIRRGEHVAGNAVHALGRTEVQATADVLAPLRNVFIRSIHGWAPSTSGQTVGPLEGAGADRVYPLSWQSRAVNFAPAL
ncbi:hypothetical protein FQZ97_769320 [compost metagenome]